MPTRKGERSGKCTMCRLPERVRAERLLAGGASLRAVSKKFGVNYHALRRHWNGHVSAEAIAAYVTGVTREQLAETLAEEGLSVLDHLRVIRGRLYTFLDATTEGRDAHNFVQIAGRLHENLRDSARLSGELQRGPLLNITNNVGVAADQGRLIAEIVSAVAPFAEARRAVALALRRLDALPATEHPLMIEAAE